MTVHVVKQGEYLSLIAARYGFRDWKTVYDHPANAAFRKKRPNPNVLHPGDEIIIPDRSSSSFQCPSGKTHEFIVKERLPDELIVLLKVGKKAIAGEECTVEFSGEDGGVIQKLSVTTSTAGELRARVPSNAVYVLVRLNKPPLLSWRIAIGHLDPVRDKHVPFDAAHCRITGIQARLNNLGFHCGKVDGELGPRTQAALRAFQRTVLSRRGADGTLDEETCSSLEAEHGDPQA